MLTARLRALGAAVCLWSTVALAQPPLEEIPETTVRGQPQPFPSQPLSDNTVVTPGRTETSANETGSSVTVVTEAQIRQSRAISVVEVLRGLPGVNVVQQGGPGGFTSVFLRGANSNQTKVLLDGIPLNDPSNAGRSFDFGSMTVDNIERIEILRGPQSTLYGSDAIGGVIQIITKRGSGPASGVARAQGGSYGTHAEGGYVSGGTDKVYYSFSGSYVQSDGFSSAAKQLGNPELDLYRNTTFSGRYGWTPSDLFEVDYVFRSIDATKGVDDFSFVTGLPIDQLNRTNITESFFQRVQLRLAPLDGDLESKLAFSVADYDRADTNTFFDPQFVGQTRKVDWQNLLRISRNNTLLVGANYFQEDAQSSSDGPFSQNDAAAFIEDRISLFDRWFTTIGSRWDNYSSAGPAYTYRATSAFNIYETGTIYRASLGTGFRAPALAENLFLFGNPNLQPEESKGWDAGIEQLLVDGLVVGATYFRNDFTNLIVFDFGTFSLQNVGRAKTHGAEVYVQSQLSQNVSMTANYTRTDTTDLATGLQLLRRPRDVASLGIKTQLTPQAALTTYLLYVGTRRDTGNFRLDDYVTLNMAGSYRVSPRVELFARAENVTNTMYEEVSGFGVPAISGYGGVNLSW